jgi:hypothetical protein
VLVFQKGRGICTARFISMRFSSPNRVLEPIIDLHRDAPLTTG